MSGAEPHTLPTGWTWATLGDLATSMRNGVYKPASEYCSDGTVTLRMYNISAGRLVLRDLMRVRLNPDEQANYGLVEGDILVNRVNSPELVGKACVIPANAGPLAFESKNIRVRPCQGISSPLVNYWLNSTRIRRHFTEECKATTGMATVDQGQLAALPVPLPPINEQKRIVAKVEALQARSDAAKEALDAIPPLLEKFRQSVLAAAFRGELTKKWREAHPDVEPASKLLERIRAERRRKWEEANPKKKYVEPEPVDTEGLPELPEGWCWATLDELTVWGPQNGLYVPKEQYGGAVPILRVDDYQIDWSRQSAELQGIDVPQAEADKYGLQVGDLVINRVNSPSHLGKSIVVGDRHIPAVFESNMMRLRLSAEVSPSLTHLYLSSSRGKDMLTRDAKWAVNQASINQGDVGRTPVPLSPSREQICVVRQIERVLAVGQASARALAGIGENLVTLNQSILAKAFRGELVPQDPNDEPASVLLERIRADRAATNAAPKQRRSRAADAEKVER
jgi:type I restriction enzyme S subunit